MPQSLATTHFLFYHKNMTLKERFKTPQNTDELKEIYKQNQLVYYTPKEELINVVTHAFGTIFALIFMVFMLIKATTPAAYASAVLSCVLIAIEFAVSATYHGVSNLKRKLIWRKVDFPAVNLNVIACAVATCLMYGTVYGYAALGVSLAIALVIFILCQARFDIFRKVSVASTFVIGGLMFAAFFTAYFSETGIPLATSLTYLFGLISCLIGALLFGVHKRYVHCVFHVFVLIGPMLFLIATYMQLR